MPSIDDLHEVLDRRARSASSGVPPIGEVVELARRHRNRRRIATAAASVVLIGAICGVIVTVSQRGPTEVRADFAGKGSVVNSQVAPGESRYSRVLADGYDLSVEFANPVPYGPFKSSPDQGVLDRCNTSLLVGVHKDASSLIPGGTMGSSMVGFVEVNSGEALSSVAFPGMVGLPPGSDPGAFRLVVSVVGSTKGATYRLVRNGEVVDHVVADGTLLALSATENPTAESDPPGDSMARLTQPYTVERVDPTGAVSALDVPAVAPAKNALADRSCSPEVDESIWRNGSPPADRVDAESQIRGLLVAVPDSGSVVGGLPRGFPAALKPGAATTAKVRDVHWVNPSEAWVTYAVTATSDRSPEALPGSHWVEVRLQDNRWKMTPDAACAFVAQLYGRSCER